MCTDWDEIIDMIRDAIINVSLSFCVITALVAMRDATIASQPTTATMSINAQGHNALCKTRLTEASRC